MSETRTPFLTPNRAGLRALLPAPSTAYALYPQPWHSGVFFWPRGTCRLRGGRFHQNAPPDIWSLDAALEPSGFTAQTVNGNVSADDLALLVSVASNVEPAFSASRPQLPAFRGIVKVTKPGNYPHDIETPGQAADVVRVIVRGLREARNTLQPRGTLHLFLAVPAGLAVMVGQSLNTFGPVQTYEHVGTDAVGVYQPATVLAPSA